MMFALRINVLAKGFSGIRRETLTRLVSAFNADCLPKIPEQGSVYAVFLLSVVVFNHYQELLVPQEI